MGLSTINRYAGHSFDELEINNLLSCSGVPPATLAELSLRQDQGNYYPLRFCLPYRGTRRLTRMCSPLDTRPPAPLIWTTTRV